MLVFESKASQSFTYGVRNESDKPLEVTLDLSASDNLVYSTKGPLVKKVVKPGEIQFMMHAQSGVGNFEKIVKHSAKEAGKK